ncbi:hypothetical protein C7N43_25060 [Sphingobacteriales bacterium UPWRP_1]|nr:hypothetical protein C7N43_25060 [Sphingobacteriales bacterium UPWRP_1]
MYCQANRGVVKQSFMFFLVQGSEKKLRHCLHIKGLALKGLVEYGFLVKPYGLHPYKQYQSPDFLEPG